MLVLTLDEKRFRSACKSLARIVAGEGRMYAVAIPVVTGGARVADIMLPELNRLYASAAGTETSDGLNRYDVFFQRPSTARKDSVPVVFRILRKLPRFVSDIIRMAESEYHSLFSREKSRRRPVLPPPLTKRIAELPEGSGVLVIDDSLDTGNTVAGICEELKRINSGLRIEVAVITTTMNNPMVIPDFSLYPARTLIRFPWSKDF